MSRSHSRGGITSMTEAVGSPGASLYANMRATSRPLSIVRVSKCRTATDSSTTSKRAMTGPGLSGGTSSTFRMPEPRTSMVTILLRKAFAVGAMLREAVKGLVASGAGCWAGEVGVGAGWVFSDASVVPGDVVAAGAGPVEPDVFPVVEPGSLLPPPPPPQAASRRLIESVIVLFCSGDMGVGFRLLG